MKPSEEFLFSNILQVSTKEGPETTVPKNTFSPTLDGIFSRNPPQLLFHYTSPAGLIGIICDKCVRATNVSHVNDPKEIQFAVDTAKFILYELIHENSQTAEERELIQTLYAQAGTTSLGYYVFSLTEERDLLSQWRAYCQPGGGYAIGFPSAHLAAMASVQKFHLWPCIYGSPVSIIISEMISAFRKSYHERRESGMDQHEARKKIALKFAQHLAYYGSVMKQDAFNEEREWRLIGKIDEGHSQLCFRPGKNGIVPYFNFFLVNDENPNLVDVNGQKTTVVSGPGVDQFALQLFLTKHLPGASRSSSRAQYRW